MVANFNPSWRGITYALRLAVLAAGGTPSVSVYPSNWGGAIRAIDELRAAIVAGGTLATHIAAPDPHSQYALDTDLAGHAATTGNGAHIPSGGITDSNVATGAAVGWAKLSKSGAVAGDVGAVGTGDARLSDARTPLAHNQLAATITDFAAAVGLVPLGLLCQGRLTLSSGVGLTTADVAAATVLYFTPYGGNGVHLWNGSAWQFYTFTELSLSLAGLAANTNYDVFLSDAPGLTLTAVAWTNSTTRASAISLRNGVWIKTSDDRRLLGTFRTTATIGQCEDSLLRRFVSNAQNIETRRLSQTDVTATWTYATGTWRQTRATATNQVEVLLSLPGRFVSLAFSQQINAGNGFAGIGVDSTTAPSPDSQIGSATCTTTFFVVASAFLIVNTLAIGYHTLSMLELASGSVTFAGTGSPATCNLKGFVMG